MIVLLCGRGAKQIPVLSYQRGSYIVSSITNSLKKKINFRNNNNFSIDYATLWAVGCVVCPTYLLRLFSDSAFIR